MGHMDLPTDPPATEDALIPPSKELLREWFRRAMHASSGVPKTWCVLGRGDYELFPPDH